MLRSRWFQAVLLALLAGTAYVGGLSAPFIFDDITSVVENSNLEHLWPMGEALRSPEHSETSFAGRPVASYSLALSYALSGREPWGFHALSLACHVASAWLLLAILRRAFATPPLGRLGAAAPALAFAAATLWALHPLASESVVYTSARSELLVGLFGLFALYAALRSFAAEARQAGWIAAAAVATLLAVGSKENAVSIPPLVLLYDQTFVSGSFARALRSHRALYASLFASWLPLALIVATSPRGKTVGFGLGLSSLDYLYTQAGVVLHYLRLALWPSPLQLIYDVAPVRSLSAALPELAGVGALALAAFWGAWHRRAAAFPLAAFFLLLAPTSSVVPIVSELAAEKRMYLPLAALVAGAVPAVWLGALALARRVGLRPRAVAIALASLGLALGGAMTLATRERVAVYASELSLWTDTLAKAPDHPFAHNNLGLVYLHQGDLDTAQRHFEAALARRPNSAPVWVNLGNVYVARGDLARATAAYERAVALMPDALEVQYNLGLILARRGRLADALPHFEAAVRIAPSDRAAHAALARAYERLGRIFDARREANVLSALGH